MNGSLDALKWKGWLRFGGRGPMKEKALLPYQ